MNKKFSRHFSKQLFEEKSVLFSRVTPLVKVWGSSLHKQKKIHDKMVSTLFPGKQNSCEIASFKTKK